MSRLLRRLHYLFRSRRSDSELAEEIELHRKLRQEALEKSGMLSSDAAAASVRKLGNVLLAREESRDVWGWTWLGDTLRDVAYASRTIARMPLVTAVIVLSLGVGIGVNTAVFSWVQAVVLQPLPGVADPSGFYLAEVRSETGAYPGLSWPEYNDVRERLSSFRELIAFRMVPLNVGEAGRTERRSGLMVSGNYFSGLGLKPALGRLTGADDASMASRVVVISDGYWKAQLGGSPDVIGRTLRINDQVLTIVGVTPENFQGTVFVLDFDLWVPAPLAPALFPGSRELEDRSQRGYSAMGRLQSGGSLVQAQAEFSAAMRQFAEAYPGISGGLTGEVLPYWRAPRGPQQFLVSGLAVLQGLMLLLLLAVCGNTANLLLARAASRSREIGTRLAIGASRWRVVRLLLTESLLLGLLGAATGVVIATLGAGTLRAVRLSMAFPIRFQTAIDGHTLLFSIVLGILCAVVFGVVPALHLVRGDPQARLRSGFNTGPRTRLRGALLAAEGALALLVLLAAALFFEDFRATLTVNPGFQIEGVLLAAYDLTGGAAGHLQAGGTVDPAYSRLFASRLLTRLRSVPGAESAAIASSIPLDIHGMPLRAFRIPGRETNSAVPDRTLVNLVTPGYFQTMQIPILSGSDFVPLEDSVSPAQVIVNQEFIRRYAQDKEATGERIQMGDETFVISGTVKNSFYESFGEAPIPAVYLSYRDRPRAFGEIHLRTRPGAETLLAGDVRRLVRELEQDLPLFNVRTLAEHVESNLFLRRIPARLFVVLGPLLLAFAAIGIYSVVAYNVAHRITEIGIRMALGATGGTVIGQIIRETLKVISFGVAAGVLVAFVVYIHVAPGRPVDPRIFLGVPAGFLLVAAASCWLPARRAASVDPLRALRQE